MYYFIVTIGFGPGKPETSVSCFKFSRKMEIRKHETAYIIFRSSQNGTRLVLHRALNNRSAFSQTLCVALRSNCESKKCVLAQRVPRNEKSTYKMASLQNQAARRCMRLLLELPGLVLKRQRRQLWNLTRISNSDENYLWIKHVRDIDDCNWKWVDIGIITISSFVFVDRIS